MEVRRVRSVGIEEVDVVKEWFARGLGRREELAAPLGHPAHVARWHRGQLLLLRHPVPGKIRRRLDVQLADDPRAITRRFQQGGQSLLARMHPETHMRQTNLAILMWPKSGE